jgi:hypothetical protein
MGMLVNILCGHPRLLSHNVYTMSTKGSAPLETQGEAYQVLVPTMKHTQHLGLSAYANSMTSAKPEDRRGYPGRRWHQALRWRNLRLNGDESGSSSMFRVLGA